MTPTIRLKYIKLSGFKSFVDPTTINLVSNLVSVVGPNGCGKSNVIDAVRWVMGESSAKQLRSGSITDVIFSGSSTRKPVGMAQVELVFDNPEGALGQEYSKYSEISVKRQVTKDGQSTYFLNNQRCRRKDITDIFLGTGLGPRSYSIIEQGMISKVIDAKPEEVRIFIEEAAGVSKYKERRRETENRLRHTHENLARLDDLQTELDKQLRHLEKQSKDAKKYQNYKTDLAKHELELAALSWQSYAKDIAAKEHFLNESAVQVEAIKADNQSLKTKSEKGRLELTDLNDELTDIQQDYYSKATKIATCEQKIANQKQQAQQLSEQINNLTQNLEAEQQDLADTKSKLTDTSNQLTEITPKITELTDNIGLLELEYKQAEEHYESWREEYTQSIDNQMQPMQKSEQLKSKITHLEDKLQQIEADHTKLVTKLGELNQENNTHQIDNLQQEIAQLSQINEELTESQINKADNLEQINSKIDLLDKELTTYQTEFNHLSKQQAALQALQDQATSQNDEKINNLLEEFNLKNCPQLYSKLDCTKDWSAAIEFVLSDWLQAYLVKQSTFDLVKSKINQDLFGFKIIEDKSYANALQTINPNSLLTKINNPEILPKFLQEVLNNIQTVESADYNVSDNQVITKNAIWLADGWLNLPKGEIKPDTGILTRNKLLETINLKIEEYTDLIATSSNLKQEYKTELTTLEQDVKDLEAKQAHNGKQLIKLEGDLNLLQARQVQNQDKVKDLTGEIDNLQILSNQTNEQITESRGALEVLLDELSSLTSIKQELEANKDILQAKFQENKNQLDSEQKALTQLKIEQQNLINTQDNLNINIKKTTSLIEANQERILELETQVEQVSEPLEDLQQELEELLESQLDGESELKLAKDKVANQENILAQISETLEQNQQNLEKLYAQTEQIKLEWQTLKVHQETSQQKLASQEKTVDEILANLDNNATKEAWQNQIQDLEAKIARLGNINLAAIEEYDSQLERQQYLESQRLDLNEAIETLEDAIKKIDKESKDKFRETFDKVNKEFKDLFPRLFGGGQADLILDSDNLLETGIKIFARPPGKKNSSIQLLSGGEKALTAIALVFAIFQLNPAPFCLLDEVDAPLDDNNVGRFCELVKYMSKTVQFIFISHNKLAIEMAEQLQGVTMREPGVSRLVTVDVEKATQLAEAI